MTNGGNTNGVPVPTSRSPGLPVRDLGLEDTEFVTGMFRALFDTVAEDAERRYQEHRRAKFLEVLAKRTTQAENALDAAQAEVRRLRERCCYEMNGDCGHDN